MSKKRYLLLFCLSLSCLFVMAQQKSAHINIWEGTKVRKTECRCYRLPWW